MEIQHIVEPSVESESSLKKTGFWRRQFAIEVTGPQIVFDVIFGAIGPVLCYVADPFVFRGGLMGPPMLQEYQAFVYLFSGLQISLLCLWLITGPGMQFWNGIIGGVFLAGSLFCFTVGLVILPYSLMGLLLGIGLFGFTPFLTSLVYARNCGRALQAKSHDPSNFTRAVSLTLGFLLVFGAPTLLGIQINQAISRAIDEIIHGDPQQAALAAHRIAPLRFFAEAELNQMVSVYAGLTDGQRKEILKSCYREITGEEIEPRVQTVLD